MERVYKLGLVFDLDMTLVDSSVAENARKCRRWSEVYALISRFTLYEGFEEVFTYIKWHGLKLAIVSSAPSTYIKRVVRHFNIPCEDEHIIGYYEAKRLVKPDPYPIGITQSILDEDAVHLISFGDRAIDIQASKAAHIQSVACFWGTQEPELLAVSGYDFALQKPVEIISLLKQMNGK